MIAFLHRKLNNLMSDERFSEILTGSVWALSAKIIATGLAMISSIFVARVYGVEIMGIMALVNSLIILATIFTNLGTPNSIMRLIPEHINKYSISSAFRVYRKIQYLVGGVSIITGTLLFLGADWIANTVFSKPQLSGFFALAACFVIAKSIMDLNTSAVRGLRLNRIFAFLQLLPDLCKLIFLITATYLFFNQNIPVYALFASWLVTAMAGLIIMQYAFKKRMTTGGFVENLPVKNILSISLPMLMSTSMVFIIGRSGVIILGMFRPEAEVGYYSIAVNLATLAAFALQAINSMSASKFSELYHSNKIDELFYVAKKSAKLIFWTTVPILLSLAVFGKPIISLLYGQSFAVAYPALLLLALGQFVNSVSGSTAMFMNMTGHQIALRNIMAGAAVINVILNLLLIPSYGIIGAALASMISITFWNIYTLVFIKRTYGQSTGYFPLLRLTIR